jgi:sestrin
MERMKSLSERSEECSESERAKRFEKVESQSAELPTVDSSAPTLKPSIEQFVDDPNFVYEDFARRGETSDIPTFRVQVYDQFE